MPRRTGQHTPGLAQELRLVPPYSWNSLSQITGLTWLPWNGKSLRMLSAQAWPRLFSSELCYPYRKVCKWAANRTERILTLLHSYKEKNPIIIVPHQFRAHMFLWFSSKPQAWSVGITGKAQQEGREKGWIPFSLTVVFLCLCLQRTCTNRTSSSWIRSGQSGSRNISKPAR